MKKNIVLFVGGGGTEHDISLISGKYIEDQINKEQFNVHTVLIGKDQRWTLQGLPIELNFQGELIIGLEKFKVDGAIPCLHGPPGETGDIQSLLELKNIPYLGCQSEASRFCFNKLVTKLLLELGGIPTSPFIQVKKNDDSESLANFFDQHQSLFIKATNQGSSIGCYPVKEKKNLQKIVQEAFKFSPFVIAEKAISGRELEVALFEFEGKWHATIPGEIVCPDDFYDYDEKYSEESKTQIRLEAPDISDEQKSLISHYSLKAQELLQIRDLARVDYFLTDAGEVLINEINTFPGHTKISMFPQMLENTGIKYNDFLNYHLNKLTS